MAPELVNDPNRVSEKADVWSLGMVCAVAAPHLLAACSVYACRMHPQSCSTGNTLAFQSCLPQDEKFAGIILRAAEVFCQC